MEDLNRAFFAHASHVYSLVADGIEMAKEPSRDLFLMLSFLNELRDFICFSKYRMCYGFDDFTSKLQDQCRKLQSSCERVDSCKAFASVTLCKSTPTLGDALERMAAAAATLLWKTQRGISMPSLAFVLRESASWFHGFSYVDLDPCRPSSTPYRMLSLDGGIVPLLPEEAKFFSSRVYEVLGRKDLELPFIINLGAGSGPDVATCLLEREGPFFALLFEADAAHAKRLEERYALWSKVKVVTDFLEPHEFPAKASEAAKEFLQGRWPPPRNFPSLLKIDVDNGDCDYLDYWLTAGYRPLVIHIEIIHSYVAADLAFNVPFSKDWSLWNFDMDISAWPSVGCSLGAVILRLRRDYSLLSWSNLKPVDAEFILTSWAQEKGIEAIEVDLVPSFWRQSVSYRELWAAEHYESLDLDPREMLNESLAVAEKRRMVVESHAALRDLLATKKVSAQLWGSRIQVCHGESSWPLMAMFLIIMV